MIPKVLLFSCSPCCTMYVKDYKTRLSVHELGGIPPLMELLNSDFPVIQQLTLKTLQNITNDKDTRNAFREERGFEKLMDILNNTVGLCICERECMRIQALLVFVLLLTPK